MSNKSHKQKQESALAGEKQPTSPAIELRIEGGHIVARCGESFAVYELVWERRHADSRQKLTTRRCEEIPVQFEREAYGSLARLKIDKKAFLRD